MKNALVESPQKKEQANIKRNRLKDGRNQHLIRHKVGFDKVEVAEKWRGKCQECQKCHGKFLNNVTKIKQKHK